MTPLKRKLLTSTVIPVLFGAGFIASNIVVSSQAHAAVSPISEDGLLPVAKPRARGIQLAAGCNPCNPCAAKIINPCNPGNPCAVKSCNPCATQSCNPCNPCNPCSPTANTSVNPCEAASIYQSLKAQMRTSYGMAGLKSVTGYQNWLNVAKTPYISETHGGRYVNNYADGNGDYRYAEYENGGVMPLGSVVAKDSFVIKNGEAEIGPLFIMEKMASGFNKSTGDWRYSMIMPNGKLFGITNGENSSAMTFCNECHEAAADNDYMWFLPDEARK